MGAIDDSHTREWSSAYSVADWRLSDRGIHSLCVIVTVTFFVTVSGQILRPPTTGRIRADPRRTAAAGPGDAVHRHVGRDRFRAAGRLGPRPPSGAGGEDAEQRRVPDAAGKRSRSCATGPAVTRTLLSVLVDHRIAPVRPAPDAAGRRSAEGFPRGPQCPGHAARAGTASTPTSKPGAKPPGAR